MGALSSIYDSFTAVVAGALPTYRQLPNGYDVASGVQLFKAKGFGITTRAGRGIELQRGTKRGRERTFGVTLINQLVHLDHDLVGARLADKTLIDDMMAVEAAIEANNSLGGLVAKVDYVDDSGVTFENSSTSLAKFVFVSVNFLVVYEETLP